MDVLSRVAVGPPAHGGHCVARVDGRVVFVRHAAPGEVVDVRLTEAGEGRRFWRGDAVAVHEPSPDRVPSRWPEAGPGGVGGGELAHLALPAQRRWKAEVVRDALRRIGHLELGHLGPLIVHPLDDDDAGAGLGTRTRIELVLDDESRAGMFRHRSHDVLALTEMPLAVPAITELDLFAADRWDGLPLGARLDVVAPSAGPVVVLSDGHPVDPDDPAGSFAAALRKAPQSRPGAGKRRSGSRGRGPGPGGRRGRGPGPGVRREGDGQEAAGPPRHLGHTGAPPRQPMVREEVGSAVGDLRYRVAAQGFWQVHRDAPATLVDAVLRAAAPEPAQHVLELYSGAGLFTLPLALAVGGQGRVDAVELSDLAVRAARRNLHGSPQAVLHAAAVTGDVVEELVGQHRPDVVVLDPPRAGAGAEVMTAVTRARPARLVYVACDPAALARDLRTAVDHGYDVVALTGYDLFPHTHHVECVAVLEPLRA